MRRAAALALALTLANSPLAAQSGGDVGTPIRRRTTYEDLQLFGQVLNQIRVNHPDSVDPHELFLAAVEAMVRAADPHSYLVPAVRLDPAREAALEKGKLQPVPIEFEYVGGAPVVVSVAAGTAAHRQDILPGDELVAVEGRPVAAGSAAELDLVLSGERKTTVRLTFERRRDDGSMARLDRVVARERVDEATAVPVAMKLDSLTGYVRVTTFVGERVADDLHAALDRLEHDGMRQLVLDLRDNGGGSVAEAARVAGEFLPRGAVVYTADGRKPEITDTGRVQRSFWRSERRYPIVVMVNAGTASASELVAGALQDHDRALIAGRPTFGKSLLMRGFPMTDGSVLVLVVGHVRTPCGRVVQRQYRSISRHEYYRLARADRDTVGRPSCRTDGGRTVYGGGGIFPDLALADPAPLPAWAIRAREQQLPLAWSGGYVDAHAAELTDADAFAARELAPATLADFRAFASKQGVSVPVEGDALLRAMLAPSIAYARWGEEGAYRVFARRDPAIRAAAAGFPRARELTEWTRQAPGR
jgi:carboxyl-terminal processing protease